MKERKSTKKLIPPNATYQQQMRKCSKPTCRRCQTGNGHGPYWYAYWHAEGRSQSAYVGKTRSATSP